MDRRSADKGAEANIYTKKYTQGYASSKTSGEGGGSSKNVGWGGSFGTGDLLPVTISAEVSGSHTKSNSWSLSGAETITETNEMECEYVYAAGYLTQYYAWAIMLPDGDNIDRVFLIPSDDGVYVSAYWFHVLQQIPPPRVHGSSFAIRLLRGVHALADSHRRLGLGATEWPGSFSC